MDAALADRIRGAWDARPRMGAVALIGSPGSGRADVMAMLRHTMDLGGPG